MKVNIIINSLNVRGKSDILLVSFYAYACIRSPSYSVILKY